jgi:hypothetical protein
MGCERPGGIFPPAASRWSTEPGQRRLFAQQAVSVVDLEACWRPHGQMKGSCGWRSLSPTLDTIWSTEGSRSRCTPSRCQQLDSHQCSLLERVEINYEAITMVG